MAKECPNCHMKPCMGGKGVGSCVSTAGRTARGSGGTIPRDEEPGTTKNPMIDCGETKDQKVEDVWHKTHTCDIRVPSKTPTHLQSHHCTCGFTWR